MSDDYFFFPTDVSTAYRDTYICKINIQNQNNAGLKKLST